MQVFCFINFVGGFFLFYFCLFSVLKKTNVVYKIDVLLYKCKYEITYL